MHTLRSIGSSVAGIAIAAGVLSAPIASAVEPAEIQGDATPSTIREVNLTDSADPENINYAITTEGENRVVDIAKLKDKDKWKGYAFGHKSGQDKHYGNHVKTLTATSAAMGGIDVRLMVPKMSDRPTDVMAMMRPMTMPASTRMPPTDAVALEVKV